MPMAPGECRFGRTTLKHVVAAAYGLPKQGDTDRLIVGGPKWIDTDLFDIWAKASAHRSQVELQQMLQALLTNRFNLRWHRETRRENGYAIVLDNAHLRLTAAASETPDRIQWSAGSLTARAITATRFAGFLTLLLGKPVGDETGLTGSYNFSLTWMSERGMWSPYGPSASDAGGASSSPSIFTAVREQLGLRLQPRKLPTEVLVIDHVEQPTAD
jgi:uncharacterized protein (TIGR03435 family)